MGRLADYTLPPLKDTGRWVANLQVEDDFGVWETVATVSGFPDRVSAENYAGRWCDRMDEAWAEEHPEYDPEEGDQTPYSFDAEPEQEPDLSGELYICQRCKQTLTRDGTEHKHHSLDFCVACYALVPEDDRA